MAQTVISVKNIGKKYRLGVTHGGRGYKTLRDSIARSAKRIVQGAKTIAGSEKSLNNPITQLPNNSQNSKEFWALKDISFDVQQGEVIGIIGRNGAGKTTLLKILSHITEPTEGEIRIRGRVASLLEVGTGFHPELTGRENIYMNGAILGMTKAEIKAKFHEIVAFAEVEKFIDTPVKRYSSGMYVRLAFAVAAHLEPEILLVDEVLAVGDVTFQKKCLGKMGNVAKRGRTVLFVSHNMGAIRQLVSRCILLEEGTITFDGDKEECISKYLQSSFSEMVSRKTFPERSPTEQSPIVIKGVALRKGRFGSYTTNFSLGEPWYLEVDLEAIKENIKFYSTIGIHNEFGVGVYHLVSFDTSKTFFLSQTHSRLNIFLPKLQLYPGKYTLDVYIGSIGYANISGKRIDKIRSAISFDVDQSSLEVSRPLYREYAVVHEVAQWEQESI